MVYLKLKSLYIEIEVKLKRKVRQNNVTNIMKKKHYRTFNYTPLFERKNNKQKRNLSGSDPKGFFFTCAMENPTLVKKVRPEIHYIALDWIEKVTP